MFSKEHRFFSKALQYAINTNRDRSTSHLSRIRRVLLNNRRENVEDVLSSEELQDLTTVLYRYRQICFVNHDELRPFRSGGAVLLDKIEDAIDWVKEVRRKRARERVVVERMEAPRPER